MFVRGHNADNVTENHEEGAAKEEAQDHPESQEGKELPLPRFASRASRHDLRNDPR